MNNVCFKALSLNVRGLRDLDKRKSIFTWVKNQEADIIFLQETYSTPDVVDNWKYQWSGEMFYSHGSNHSKGVLVLIRDTLQFELKSSKALTLRLGKVLSDIISPDQCAYVKGRNNFDAVRTINDIMDYTNFYNLPGLMVTIDFEKAFDSLSWNFLIKTLEKFNFGKSFIQWVRILYTNISSCIMNNGVATPLFSIGRGVRQGDPLSPYLFILALETFLASIKQNPDIKGIEVDDKEIKCIAFADDLTNFLRDKESYAVLSSLLETYGKCSGLKLNKDKKEAYWLGSSHYNHDTLDINKVNEPIKILGIFFTYDRHKSKELNFDLTLKSLKKSLNCWQWRNLTLIGKIQLVKTLAMPKFMYRASLISFDKDIIKSINSVIFNFVWKGKDKIKRLALISSYEDGGLKMPHPESLVTTQRIACIKKYLDENASPWKVFLSHYLKNRIFFSASVQFQVI